MASLKQRNLYENVAWSLSASVSVRLCVRYCCVALHAGDSLLTTRIAFIYYVLCKPMIIVSG